ncbi:phosphoglucomutase/phosphomannomutase PgmG [Novosphingobium mangrovi (ex Huang et al. 2023)]|uniref:Phosphomannomutase/phosphoglucomutase n=1 Tax=Novosphingobium mangrovi (ex Huang et al. 2023) TaxID=2976432 RepID=A0ABT2I2X5_9SPHN|nr:phosphomannomutase/phosphoglucomutase [Novosphingobium mangrovi (ex Huang et al. 2023)]MCT2399159.1 phosphomannomutase/phosphoglucomutase [Novosphingobium mangrovi (ex Huang et al. 2023)]
MSVGHGFDPSILREYDIRGVVGQTLGPKDAYALGRTFATVLRRGGGSRIAVGYDGRLSSPVLEEALVEGLLASGIDVARIGLGPTPMLNFAEASAQDVDGGIQVTGSHNPRDHNGFKMVVGGRPFFGADIQRLGAMAAVGDWEEGSGRCESRAVFSAYVDRLVEGLAGIADGDLAGLRIGWDAGNGAGGPAVELLTSKLPGEHHLLFTEVDGCFPHHHPDPTIEANLADLKALVARDKLDFGVAFDGDADRIGAVDGTGRVIWGDQLLSIFAEDLLLRHPGATVVADVKASRTLFDGIARLGGYPVMWKSGHSLIKSKMQETGAALGGEMSGHVFFADDYFGFDDGLYAAVRLMAATVRLGRSLTEMRSAMPAMFDTPELRFPVDPARKFAAVEEVRMRLTETDARVVDVDGVRVTDDDGWWLLRASNTQDVLTARAESDTAEGLERLVGRIDAQLALSGLARA